MPPHQPSGRKWDPRDRNQTRHLEGELRDRLMRWDPIGIRGEPEWPQDEYDCMVFPIMSKLSNGATDREIASRLRTELVEHFGLDATAGSVDAARFAPQLVRWWNEANAFGL